MRRTVTPLTYRRQAVQKPHYSAGPPRLSMQAVPPAVGEGGSYWSTRPAAWASMVYTLPVSEVR
jgi:hypothetical protein